MKPQWRAWHGWMLGFMLLIVLPTFIQRPDRTDLHLLVQAAHRLMAGEAVYRLQDVNEHTKPPLVTFLFLGPSQIPLFWLSRLWDLLNVLACVFLLRVLVRKVEPLSGVLRFSLALMAAFLCLTPLNAELRLGQYNILFLAWLTAAGFYRRDILAGVGLCLAVLFKPPFIFLMPWILRGANRPLRVLGAGAGALAIICAAYALSFGAHRLVADCSEWARFLPQSSAKHLLRPDNHGLPSALAALWGGNPEKIFLLVGIAWATAFAFFVPDRVLALALGCVAMVVFTPMAWMQNYSLLLPAGVWAFDRLAKSRGIARGVLAASVGVLWIGIGALNPTTCAWTACEQWTFQRVPLWALLAALGLAVLSQYIGCFWRGDGGRAPGSPTPKGIPQREQ